MDKILKDRKRFDLTAHIVLLRIHKPSKLICQMGRFKGGDRKDDTITPK